MGFLCCCACYVSRYLYYPVMVHSIFSTCDMSNVYFHLVIVFSSCVMCVLCFVMMYVSDVLL